MSIWNWATNSWVVFDSRQVGPTSVALALAPTGAPANYVSNLSGNGEVAVRIGCTRTDLVASFYASGDQLKIQYTP